ncbi:hydroxyacid dehydrogenase [Benzoatithermus flavus]|uniref:Hydroxyacid dehydrogenase n=1 Tax=Benzoatithermus flavus TaxID=3108223 RepID=A0ABU8XM62_9PROT
MLDIVVSEFMDEAALDGLRSEFEVHYDPTLADRPRELELLVSAARALIVRNRTRVQGPLLAAARRLEVVGRLGVGLDNIDLDACRARGIEVLPATGANAVAVAEYVIAAALVLLRGVFAATDAMLEGQWPRERLVGREAARRRMGFVGFGSTARQVASRAAALGMRIAAYDPHLPATDPVWQGVERHETLEGLLAAADVLSLHVPLTAETRGLIDATALSAMRPGAVLINTSRGGILDEAALVEALRAGRLAGAALDVFATEPLDRDTALLFDAAPNLILTPHIAGVTVESNERVSAMTAANVRKALKRKRA